MTRATPPHAGTTKQPWFGNTWRRGFYAAAVGLLLAMLLASPASGQSSELSEIEQVLRQHLEALGGEAALQAIAMSKRQGSFSTNGIPSPELLIVSQGRLRHERGSWKRGQQTTLVVTTLNEAGGWQKDPTEETAERTVEGDELVSLQILASEPVPSLLACREASVTCSFKGSGETDFGPAIRIELKRTSPQGSPPLFAETWFLDPKTHLPLERHVHRWDWGRIRDLRYYYSDWTPVELAARSKVPESSTLRVLLPFLIEDEFSSFHRSLAVTTWTLERESSDDQQLFQPNTAALLEQRNDTPNGGSP